VGKDGFDLRDIVTAIMPWGLYLHYGNRIKIYIL
jgi:hypothetical protein